MLTVAFFRRLGFYVQEHFLSEQRCAELRAEMQESSFEAAGVVTGGSVTVDETRRRTHRAQVSSAMSEEFCRLVESLRPALEEHFGLALGLLQEPQFLLYRPGDYFRLHADTNYAADSPSFLTERKVSIIVFLGHSGAEEGESGGDLLFRELLPDERLADRAFPFPLSSGMLVAFRAELLHEVAPVIQGERYSIVTWFTGREPV
jgi:SM-20-related protein